jgi:uncharacterized protein YneF (UPF0154 family)
MPNESLRNMNFFKTIVKLPPVLLWSLIYGVLGGLFFKAISVFEYWLESNRSQIMQWKRYPNRNYRQFTSAILMGRVGAQSWATLPLTYSQITSRFDRAPYPYLVIMCNTLIALVYLPVALALGVVQGPAFVFHRSRINA